MGVSVDPRAAFQLRSHQVYNSVRTPVTSISLAAASLLAILRPLYSLQLEEEVVLGQATEALLLNDATCSPHVSPSSILMPRYFTV